MNVVVEHKHMGVKTPQVLRLILKLDQYLHHITCDAMAGPQVKIPTSSFKWMM